MVVWIEYLLLFYCHYLFVDGQDSCTCSRIIITNDTPYMDQNESGFGELSTDDHVIGQLSKYVIWLTTQLCRCRSLHTQ